MDVKIFWKSKKGHWLSGVRGKKIGILVIILVRSIINLVLINIGIETDLTNKSPSQHILTFLMSVIIETVYIKMLPI